MATQMQRLAAVAGMAKVAHEGPTGGTGLYRSAHLLAVCSTKRVPQILGGVREYLIELYRGVPSGVL